MGYVFTLSGSVVSWKATWQATNCFIDHGGRHMTESGCEEGIVAEEFTY